METIKRKLMRIYANQINILTQEHMRSFPVVGYCRIDMVGDDTLKGCIGEELYCLLGSALKRLREMDAEIARRRLYLGLITRLSKMALRDLEDECLDILRMPRPEKTCVKKPARQHNALLFV